MCVGADYDERYIVGNDYNLVQDVVQAARRYAVSVKGNAIQSQSDEEWQKLGCDSKQSCREKLAQFAEVNDMDIGQIVIASGSTAGFTSYIVIPAGGRMVSLTTRRKMLFASPTFRLQSLDEAVDRKANIDSIDCQ